MLPVFVASNRRQQRSQCAAHEKTTHPALLLAADSCEYATLGGIGRIARNYNPPRERRAVTRYEPGNSLRLVPEDELGSERLHRPNVAWELCAARAGAA